VINYTYTLAKEPANIMQKLLTKRAPPRISWVDRSWFYALVQRGYCTTAAGLNCIRYLVLLPA